MKMHEDAKTERARADCYDHTRAGPTDGTFFFLDNCTRNTGTGDAGM